MVVPFAQHNRPMEGEIMGGRLPPNNISLFGAAWGSMHRVIHVVRIYGLCKQALGHMASYYSVFGVLFTVSDEL